MRKAALFAGVCVVLAAAVGTGIVLGGRTDEVAAVDGHPVTRAELIFHMRRLAPAVRNEMAFSPLKGGGGAVGQGADPRDDAALIGRLRERALAEAERDKVLLLLAKEQGLVDSVDHEDFLAEVRAENKRRAESARRGEVVYGVTEFSPEEYYTKRLTDLTTALTNALSVTDAEVRAEFDTDRASWSANATTYAYSKLVVPVPAGASADYPAGLQSRVAAAGGLAEVAAAEPGARLTSASYAGGESSGVNAHDQDLMAVLTGLSPGQISAPIPGPDQITYYELDRRTVDANAAFAQYAPRIRQSLMGEKFDRYVDDRLAGSDIEVDTEALADINPEDVA